MSLPTTPIAVISIPIISIASDITTANIGAPKPRGCAIIRPDIAILNIPTPTRGALNQMLRFDNLSLMSRHNLKP